MDKWIFVNNITSLDKLYILTKAVDEEYISEKNHAIQLKNALNRAGANRNEANNHPINYVVFYGMVKLDGDRYIVTEDGRYLLDNYDSFLDNKKLRAQFFFKVLLKIKFPNSAVETSELYNVSPFVMIFKLLFDNRINKRLTIKEMEEYLSIIYSNNDYDKFVKTLNEIRSGKDIEITCSKIAQMSTVVAGWVNQFCVMKKEGDFIMLSDELKVKMPFFTEKKINMCPYNDDFISFVINKYLFGGLTPVEIENEYFQSTTRTGSSAIDILDYYQINNDSNKGIYKDLDYDFVISYFEFEQNSNIKRIVSALKKEHTKVEVDEKTNLEKYRDYYVENLDILKENKDLFDGIKLRNDFINEYPLDRIKDLTLDEYSLGTPNFKESLSYKLEFGKYKHVGLGIGGGTSAKHGIYLGSNGTYLGRKNEPIDNPEEFWTEFRNQLYSFLVEIGEGEEFPDVHNKYPLLESCPIVLSKLCFLYYPEKFVNIGAKGKLIDIVNAFDLDINKDSISTAISFELDKYLRSNVPELLEDDPQWIGHSLWRFINTITNSVEDEEEEDNSYDEYSREDFLNDVFISEEKYDSIISLLEKKKNIILQGAPGVGKTFIARRLAYSIMGYKDKSRVKFIQFHQSYSYEEFIEGYRPKDNSFVLEKGLFYECCKNAESNPDENYYLIIDEINRGNLSKIFGELLMLIESDKRGQSLNLPYSNEDFSVPKNLFIIGLMNTADRSLALIDYALRRRFSFITIDPAFGNEKFISHFNEQFDNPYVEVINLVNDINKDICEDPSLGEGFMIGHSYFCPDISGRKATKKDIKDIFEYDIIPLLEEYWYDEKDKLDYWKKTIDNVINQ